MPAIFLKRCTVILCIDMVSVDDSNQRKTVLGVIEENGKCLYGLLGVFT